MAWPFTATTSYVATTTPSIKASDLNNFQSAINGVYGATKTVKRISVDAIGNVSDSATNLIQTFDSAGTLRYAVDSYGYPRMGDINRIVEHWDLPLLDSGSAAQVLGRFRKMNPNGSAGMVRTAAGATHHFTHLVGTVAAAADVSYVVAYPNVAGTHYCVSRHSNITLVAEFDVAFTTLTDSQAFFGISNNYSSAPSASDSCVIATSTAASNVGKWNLLTADGGTLTTGVTGTAISGSMQRMRIELHGASTAVGSQAFLFCNDAPIATSTTHLPANGTGLYWFMTVLANGASANASVAFGPTSLTFNRY